MRKVVMVDIDGVLADFVWAFTSLLSLLFGGRPRHTWEMREWSDFGKYTPEQVNKAWSIVRDSRSFWVEVPDLLSINGLPEVEALRPLAWVVETGQLDLYFVTSRVGRTAKTQTEMWLRERNIYHPTVIVSDRKGLVARAVGATAVIDDSPKQLWKIGGQSPDTVVYVMDRPYNTHISVGRRVGSTQEFVRQLEVGT